MVTYIHAYIQTFIRTYMHTEQDNSNGFDLSQEYCDSIEAMLEGEEKMLLSL
jgi:hypothetical protein